jgi:hypothetical protein
MSNRQDILCLSDMTILIQGAPLPIRAAKSSRCFATVNATDNWDGVKPSLFLEPIYSTIENVNDKL